MNWTALLILAASLATAAEDVVRPDRPGLQIKSEEFEIELKEKTYVYRRNVVVTDPPAKPGDPPTILKCQLLTARTGTNGGFETIVAEEDVHISRGDQFARGEKAVYTRATEKFDLYRGEKPAMYVHGGVTNFTDRIEYNRTNSSFRMVGGVRTEIPLELLQRDTNSPAGISKGFFP